MIRHAFFQALAVLTLAVAMILTPFAALLMAAVGFAALQTATFFTAPGTAIALAAVTMAAEIKHHTAWSKVTYALAKNSGTSNGHRLGRGALDSRHRSWEDDLA